MSINRRPTNEPDLSHVIPQWTDSQEDAVEFSSLIHGGAIPAMDALKTAVHQLRNKGGADRRTKLQQQFWMARLKEHEEEIERDEKRKLKARKRRAARKRAKMMKKAMEEIDEHARERLT